MAQKAPDHTEFLKVLAKLKTFRREDARKLYPGERPFQSTWSYLISRHLLRRSLKQYRSLRTLWRVSTNVRKALHETETNQNQAGSTMP